MKTTAILLILLSSITWAGADSAFELHAVAEKPKAATGDSASAGLVELPVATSLRGTSAPSTMLVNKAVLMDASALKATEVRQGRNGWEILLEFTESGRAQFAKISTEYVGKEVAIMIGGEVVSAPHINEPITGGSVLINGSFSEAEARALGNHLQAAIAK